MDGPDCSGSNRMAGVVDMGMKRTNLGIIPGLSCFFCGAVKKNLYQFDDDPRPFDQVECWLRVKLAEEKWEELITK